MIPSYVPAIHLLYLPELPNSFLHDFVISRRTSHFDILKLLRELRRAAKGRTADLRYCADLSDLQELRAELRAELLISATARSSPLKK